jgi:hypothetical protein
MLLSRSIFVDFPVCHSFIHHRHPQLYFSLYLLSRLTHASKLSRRLSFFPAFLFRSDVGLLAFARSLPRIFQAVKACVTTQIGMFQRSLSDFHHILNFWELGVAPFTAEANQPLHSAVIPVSPDQWRVSLSPARDSLFSLNSNCFLPFFLILDPKSHIQLVLGHSSIRITLLKLA